MVGVAVLHLAAAVRGTSSGAFGAVNQHYLFEARQMQALSFAAHIPLVCFGIAFPAIVLFTEWLGRRTGDPPFCGLARRWARVLLAALAGRVRARPIPRL